jgi:hypothetical protein
MQTTATVDTAAALASWPARVGECVRSIWGEQAFQLPASDRKAGVEALVQQRSDFDARVLAIANSIATVASQLATPGDLADAEYDALLLEPMHRQLSFLTAKFRKVLAHKLIAEYATQPVAQTAWC